MILNLDHQFQPFGPSTIKHQCFTFAGGEPHIKLDVASISDTSVQLTHRIQSFNDFGLLLVAIDALRRSGVDKIDLFIPYFPAARQDRVMVPGEPLTVKVMANLLNNCGVRSVRVFDAHSEVTSAVLNNPISYNNHLFIHKVIENLPEKTVLISPDGGALKKIYKLAQYLKGYDVVECSKVRNVATGKLESFQVYTDDLNNRPCLIVDDICDGGGTFLGLADALKSKQSGNLYLAVSHGIFSKGLETLSTVFKHIYCTNSFKTISNRSDFTQIEINHSILNA